MNDDKVIDSACEVFIRNAITLAANNALQHLQDLINITDGGYAPDIALHLPEHLEALVKDYCDILSDQRMTARL